MAGFELGRLKEHIPYYLTRPQKEALLQELARFKSAKSVQYYTRLPSKNLLQGDGKNGLIIIDFHTGERVPTKGILLSNSCDMSFDNLRDIPLHVSFAPLISLEKYEQLLRKSGIRNEKITAKLDAIRGQGVSNIFYLPEKDSLGGEYLALLDNICCIPSEVLHDTPPAHLFTLSMFGFYLFLFKISVHFCRFHEEINRDEV